MISRRELLAVLTVPVFSARVQRPNIFSDAESYERFMGRWSRLLAPLLVDFVKISDSGQILDIGSGTGSLSFAIAEKRPRCHILGIDPSQEYVAYAKSKNPFPARVNFQVGDAQDLKFPDASFESSHSLLVFNFIPNSRRALQEVRRVTKPGGWISAAVWDYGAGMRMLRVFWDAAASLDARAEALDEKHMPLCRAGELSQLWKDGGLAEVQETPLDIAMRFHSFADYWEAFQLGQGPAGTYARTLGPEKLKSLRSEVKSRLSSAADATPFALPARAWAVRGTIPGHS